VHNIPLLTPSEAKTSARSRRFLKRLSAISRTRFRVDPKKANSRLAQRSLRHLADIDADDEHVCFWG